MMGLLVGRLLAYKSTRHVMGLFLREHHLPHVPDRGPRPLPVLRMPCPTIEPTSIYSRKKRLRLVASRCSMGPGSKSWLFAR